jgi:hypothetical protein
MFAVAREMMGVAAPLKPNEKAQLRRDELYGELEDLVDRVDRGWKTYFEQVMDILRR